MLYDFIHTDYDGKPDGEVARQNFKELCGSFQSALSLGPCVLLIDGVDELGASMGLSPQEVQNHREILFKGLDKRENLEKKSALVGLLFLVLGQERFFFKFSIRKNTVNDFF